MEFRGKILAAAYERGEVENDESILVEAYRLGASL
jgi:hypothetical protein